MIKTCRNCGVPKKLDLFPKQKTNKDGHHSYCKQCRSLYDKSRYNSNDRKEKYLASQENERKKRREYYRNNKQKYYIKKAERRASLLKCMPKWLSFEQKEAIKAKYSVSKMFNKHSSIRYEVDHIVPLKGKTVCGLHVPWNLQVIPLVQNRSKSNKL